MLEKKLDTYDQSLWKGWFECFFADISVRLKQLTEKSFNFFHRLLVKLLFVPLLLGIRCCDENLLLFIFLQLELSKVTLSFFFFSGFCSENWHSPLFQIFGQIPGAACQYEKPYQRQAGISIIIPVFVISIPDAAWRLSHSDQLHPQNIPLGQIIPLSF